MKLTVVLVLVVLQVATCQFQQRAFLSPFFDNSLEDDSDERFGAAFGSRQHRPRTPQLQRPSFGRSSLHDSLEDILEDLHDEDADDRARAQAALARLGGGNPPFRSAQSRSQTGGASGFTNHFGKPHSNFRNGLISSGPSALSESPSHKSFSSGQHRFSNRNGFSGGFSSNTNGFLRSSASSHNSNGFSSSSSNNNRFSRNNHGFPHNHNSLPHSQLDHKQSFGGSKLKTRSSPNSVPSQAPKKKSPLPSLTFPRPPGINWTGGSGYYFSMSHGNSKPVTYYVKYDD